MNYELNEYGPPGDQEGGGDVCAAGAAMRLINAWARAATRICTILGPRAAAGQDIAFSGRRLALAILVATALLIPDTGLAQPAGDAAAAEESRDRVLASDRYQTDRPEPPELEKRDEPMSLPDWLVKALLWTIAAIVVGMILIFLFNALQNRSGFRINRDRGRQTAEIVETPVSARQKTIDDRTLEEADALAAEGRFAEAIHLLLLVAMDRLKRELGARLAPALTSREVLQLAPIPEAVIEPLGRMVSLSEIKHFGGRNAAAPDYDQCRRDFLQFSGSGASA